MTDTLILELKGVSKYFGAVRALADEGKINIRPEEEEQEEMVE